MGSVPRNRDFSNRDCSCYNFPVTDPKAGLPAVEELTEALRAAGSAHHEYEQTVLHGVRHEEWAAFYAAYVLGRLGDFVKPSVLSGLLTEAPLADNWAESAAAHVLTELGRK